MEKEFLEKGFVRVPFLNPDELASCRSLFEQVDPGVGTSFYSSIDSRNKEYRMRVDQELRNRVAEKTKSFFVAYEPIAFTFIVKRSSPDTLIRMHVDDTHTDQNQFVSVNIWSPLVDTNETNGGLKVVQGSHLLPFPQRGLGLPFPYSNYEHLFRPFEKEINLRAGEAIFYHDQLIHGSPPNRSGAIRPAIITGMIPREAQPLIYFRYPGLPDTQCEKFEVSGDFWYEFDKSKRPDQLKSLGIESYSPISISESEFIRILEKSNQKDSFLSKLTSIFKTREA